MVLPRAEIRFDYFDIRAQAAGWINTTLKTSICSPPFYADILILRMLKTIPSTSLVDINAQWGWEVTREISDLCRVPCRLVWPSHEYKYAAWQLESFCHFPHESAELRRKKAKAKSSVSVLAHGGKMVKLYQCRWRALKALSGKEMTGSAFDRWP